MPLKGIFKTKLGSSSMGSSSSSSRSSTTVPVLPATFRQESIQICEHVIAIAHALSQTDLDPEIHKTLKEILDWGEKMFYKRHDGSDKMKDKEFTRVVRYTRTLLDLDIPETIQTRARVDLPFDTTAWAQTHFRFGGVCSEANSWQNVPQRPSGDKDKHAGRIFVYAVASLVQVIARNDADAKLQEHGRQQQMMVTNTFVPYRIPHRLDKEMVHHVNTQMAEYGIWQAPSARAPSVPSEPKDQSDVIFTLDELLGNP